MFGSVVNKLAAAVRRLLSPYAVGSFEPALAYDFVNGTYRTNNTTQSPEAAFTHTRSGNATMVDSDGLLKWGPHNLLTYSETFGDNYASIASQGTTTATTLANGIDGYVITATSNREFYSSPSLGVQAAGSYTIEIYVDSFSGIFARPFAYLPSSPAASLRVNDIVDGKAAVSFTWAGGDMGTLRVGVGTDTNDTGEITLGGLHLYRSDLGGMVNNPATGDSYVPTTSSARYLPRIGNHIYNGSAWVNEGMLHESEARTNIATDSDMSSAVAEGCTRTANNAVSPDGTENAFTVTASSTAPAYLAYSGLLTSGESYAVSVYAKAGTHDIIRIANVSSSLSAQWFDLTNGTLLASNGANNTATIQDVGNGWYRCTRYFDSVTTGGSAGEIFVANSSANGATAAISGSTIHLYGFQIENNSTSSSFIPTSGSTVTRAADTLTVPSANLPWPTPEYIGPELVTNGTFDTDTSGWTADDSTLSVVGQKLRVTSTGDYSRAFQAVSVEAGKAYIVSCDVNFISGTSNQNELAFSSNASSGGGTPIGTSSVINGDGTHSFVWVSPSTGTYYLRVQSNSGSTNEIFDFDNISVREINPLSVSIQMDGLMTYADTGATFEVIPLRYYADASNYIDVFLNCFGTRTGEFNFRQQDSGVLDQVTSSQATYTPGINVPYNIASRHGSTFINGAVDGVALTADTTPTALPDLSSTDLDLGYDYMGNIGTFRVWSQDIGDDGIEEATS